MNLSKLFEMQKELDDHIEHEHQREPGEDRKFLICWLRRFENGNAL